MKFSLLASGSSGNSIFVQEGTTRVLVDAGLAGKRIEERLDAVGVSAASIQAIVVSHEHSDHIQGVGVLARRFNLPVWMTEGTFEACKAKVFRGKERVRLFENDEAFSLGDLRFEPYSLSHDAADPVNFMITGREACLGIATDMGIVTHLVRNRLRGADLVILESNYDRNMLMYGPYPWKVKQRISGNRGHLSNGAAAQTLRDLVGAGLKQAVLAHLSDHNNRPELARETCRAELNGIGARDVALSVATPERPTPVRVV